MDKAPSLNSQDLLQLPKETLVQMLLDLHQKNVLPSAYPTNYTENYLSEIVLSQLIDGFPFGLVSLNKELEIIHWNKEAEMILGYTTQEIAGKSCALFLDEATYLSFQNNGLVKGEISEKDVFEVEAFTSNKQKIYLQCYPFRYEQPKLSYQTFLFQDITSQKIAQIENQQHLQSLERLTSNLSKKREETENQNKMLSDANLQLQKLNTELALANASIDLASEIIFWLDEEGRILRVNTSTCASLGYTRSELEQMCLYQIAPSEAFSPENYPTRWKEIRALKNTRFENNLRHKNGETFPVETLVTWVYFGEKEWCFVFIKDISKRKEAEKALLDYQHNLENIIQERTQDLEKVNRRLKAGTDILLIHIDQLKATHQKLLKARTELLEAQKLANLGNWSYHFETQTHEWSEQVYLQYGLKVGAEIPKGSAAFQLIYPADIRLFQQKYEQAVEEGFADFEMRIQNQDGIIRYIQTRIRPNYDKNGKVIGLFGVNLDITEQKHKEMELRLAKYSLEKAPLMIEWIDENGEYIYVNELSAQYSDFAQEELIGKKIYEIDPNFTQETWKENFNHTIRNSLKNFETIHRRKSNQQFPILVNAIHVDFEGKNFLCVFVTDISQLKDTEQKLQDAIENLRTSEEELRQNTEELSAINDNLEEAKSLLEKSIENEKIANEKIERRSKSLYTQKRELRKALSQLKQAQEQLVQSEKMASLGVLVAGIAHELNNPVNYINASSEALKILLEDFLSIIQAYEEITPHNVAKQLDAVNQLKQMLDFEDLQKGLDELISNIKSGAEQTADIVRGLRNFSKMDGGELEVTDIHTHLDTSLVMLHAQYKNQIEIIKDYQLGTEVECYPSKLQQVFMNIFINAIQAIQERKSTDKGLITIKTYTLPDSKSQFVIEIEDNGVGIPDEIKNRIFEPFFTNKEVGKGTGLGLSITLGIVENHHGTIQVESEIGKGTKFILRLPLKQV